MVSLVDPSLYQGAGIVATIWPPYVQFVGLCAMLKGVS